LIAEHGRPFTPDEIDEITIATFRASYEIIGGEPEKWRPQSRETADHSLPYITCAALVDGTVTLETFDESRFRDETLLALVARTKVVPDDDLDRLYPEQGIPNLVTVTLKNGQVLQRRVDAPKGHALNPMSDEEVEAKFRSMAERVLRPIQVEAAIASCMHLDEVDELEDLFEPLIV